MTVLLYTCFNQCSTSVTPDILTGQNNPNASTCGSEMAAPGNNMLSTMCSFPQNRMN